MLVGSMLAAVEKGKMWISHNGEKQTYLLITDILFWKQFAKNLFSGKGKFVEVEARWYKFRTIIAEISWCLTIWTLWAWPYINLN